MKISPKEEATKVEETLKTKDEAIKVEDARKIEVVAAEVESARETSARETKEEAVEGPWDGTPGDHAWDGRTGSSDSWNGEKGTN